MFASPGGRLATFLLESIIVYLPGFNSRAILPSSLKSTGIIGGVIDHELSIVSKLYNFLIYQVFLIFRTIAVSRFYPMIEQVLHNSF